MTGTKESLHDLIISITQGSRRDTGIGYGELYAQVCEKEKLSISRRDFQKALDVLSDSFMLIVEDDPKDRRKKVIYQNTTIWPGRSRVDFFANELRRYVTKLLSDNLWLMPVKIPLAPVRAHSDAPKDFDFKKDIHLPFLEGLSENEVRALISIEQATWRKVLIKIGDNDQRSIQRKMQEFKNEMAEINAEELANAFRERRVFDRSRVIACMRERLAALV